MHNSYYFDKSLNILKVFSRTGISDFCSDNYISPSYFNYDVIIDDSVTDCSCLFSGCSRFNRP